MRDWLEREVRARAKHRCEYCHIPEAFDELACQVDHIIARQHGGQTVLSNLALACYSCNLHKGPNLSGIDPRVRLRRAVNLFNPRRHRWPRHFRWDGAVLIGRTSIGRATVAVLAINMPLRIRLREELLQEGRFPLE